MQIIYRIILSLLLALQLSFAGAVVGASTLIEGGGEVITGKDQLIGIELALVANGTSTEDAKKYSNWIETGVAVITIVNGVAIVSKVKGASKGTLASIDDFATNKGGVGSLSDGTFAQVKAKPNKAFSDDGKRIYSDLAGAPIETVQDLTNAIKSGKVKPADIEVNYVVINGKTVVDNTRTSTALTNAGILKSQWFGRNQTGAEAFPGKTFDQLAADQLRRNGLPPTGASSLPGGQ